MAVPVNSPARNRSGCEVVNWRALIPDSGLKIESAAESPRDGRCCLPPGFTLETRHWPRQRVLRPITAQQRTGVHSDDRAPIAQRDLSENFGRVHSIGIDSLR